MKKQLLMMLVAMFTFAVTSCNDNNEGTPSFDKPTITVPTGTQAEFSASVDLTFQVEVPGKIGEITVSTSDGTATGDFSALVGETSGSATVSYTAPATAGNQTVTLTVTDQQATPKSESGIATVEVLAKVTEVTVNSNITADATWTSDKTYILATRVTVLDGVTLTIEPGTVIKGEAGTGDNATALLIARGGKLMAEGTAAAPIIFTSVADELTPEDVAAGNFASPNLEPNINGLWGGIIVLGSAHISASNDNGDDVNEIQIEGIPTSDPNGLYGGTNDADNSGKIAYISIRHGGTNIGSGNEINGLTLGGVGSGTSISNIEVVANQDDGMEYFGGTVNTDKILIWNQGDDGLDTDQAWNGTCSNFLIVAPQGGSGLELDGPEGTYINGNHHFNDGVIYAGDAIDALVDFDPNTNADISNLYIYAISQGTVKEYTTPLQSFTGLEYTWADGVSGLDPAVVFENVDPAEVTEVAANQNTVGYSSASDFSWTWASKSGSLAAIGLE